MDSAAELRLADVEGCLKDLDTHVTPTVSGSEAAAKVDEDDARFRAEQLLEILADVETDSEKAAMASVLLHSGTGLLRFLRLSTDPDNSQTRSKCRELAIKALAIFISRAPTYAEVHSAEIVAVCFKAYKNDRTNSVKQAALAPITAVLTAHYPRLEVRLREGDSGMTMQHMLLFIERDFKVGKKATHSQTMKAKMLDLLAVWALHYPEQFKQTDEGKFVPRIREICENVLKEQYDSWSRQLSGSSIKPQFFIIRGGIDLLRGICALPNTSESPVRHGVDVRELFKYFMFTIDRYLQDDFKRFHVLKATLYFLAKHGGLLRSCFMPRVEEVLQWQMALCKHTNRDVRNLAWDAMETFVRSVAAALLDNEEDGLNTPKRKAVCGAFVNTFLTGLRQNWSSGDDDDGDEQDEDAVDHQARRRGRRGKDSGAMMILRAVGQFAEPIQFFFANDELRRGVKGLRGVLQEIIDYTRLMLSKEAASASTGQEPDIEDHLPDTMRALGNILVHLPDIDDEVQTHVSAVISKFTEVLPSLQTPVKVRNCDALWRLLLGLGKQKPKICDELVDSIVDENVKLAISRKDRINSPDLDDEIFVSGREHYTEFMQLLLSTDRWTSNPNTGELQQRRLQARIYQGLMSSITDNICRLDTSLVRPAKDDSAETDHSVDEVCVPQPSNQADFDIFISLVEFCQELLPTCVPKLFLPWIVNFTSVVIDLLEKDSVSITVSGYYKLLTIVCHICTDQRFFRRQTETGIDVRDACRRMLVVHVQRTSVRLTQFTSDLLVAAIKSVLCVPHELLAECIVALREPMRLGLKIGLTHTPLAEFAVETLEGWVAESRKESAITDAVGQIWPHVLPVLNEYLYVSADSGLLSAEELAIVEDARAIRQDALRIDKEQLNLTASTDVLRRRILKFLGTIGGHAKGLLHTTHVAEFGEDVADGTDLVVWDQVEYANFSMPLSDSDKNPTMFLDSLLPRIMTLAESSSDRKTKSAACELLHGVILLCVAGTHQATKVKHDIFKQLFPCILRLSVDADVIPQQLFGPLTKQLIHWYTKDSNVAMADAELLLESILEATCHPTAGNLRESAAAALAEFLKYALKTKKRKSRHNHDADGTPLGADMLLKRLFQLARHPDPYRRIGSALAFTRIYRLFRDDQNLVGEYLFQCIDEYLVSLKMSYMDSTVLSASELTLEVIKHLQKIVILQIKHIEDVRTIRKQLTSLMERLLQNCGSYENTPSAYRKACADLFFAVVRDMYDDENACNYTPQSFLQEWGGLRLNDDPDGPRTATAQLIGLFEKNESDSRLPRFVKTGALSPFGWYCGGHDPIRFLNATCACAEAYSRILTEKCCTTEALLLSGGKDGSKFLKVLNAWAACFVQDREGSPAAGKFVCYGVEDLLNLPHHDSVHCRLCGETLLTALHFLHVALEHLTNQERSAKIMGSNGAARWTSIVVMLVMDPRRMGCVDKSQQSRLRTATTNILKNLSSWMGKNEVAALVKAAYLDLFQGNKVGHKFAIKFQVHSLDLAKKVTDYTDIIPVMKNHTAMLQGCSACSIFLKTLARKLIAFRGPGTSGEKEKNPKGRTAITLAEAATPSDIEISRTVLRFCLDTRVPCSEVCLAMTDSVAVSGVESISRGHIFCQRYRQIIAERAFRKVTLEDFGAANDEVRNLVTQLSRAAHKASHVYGVLNFLIEESCKSIYGKDPLRKVYKQIIIDVVLEHLSSDAVDVSFSQVGPELLELMGKLVRSSGGKVFAVTTPGSKLFRDYFLDCLHAKNLDPVVADGMSTVHKALLLVPWLLKSCQHDESAVTSAFCNDVIKCLQTICTEKITCESDPSELQNSTRAKEYADYVFLLDRLLQVLQLCSSVDVLQIFYPLLLQQDHFYESNIYAGLESFAHNGASSDTFSRCWEESLDDELDFSLRRCLVNQICVKMLDFMPRAEALATINRHMPSWKENVNSKATNGGQLLPTACSVLQRAALTFYVIQAAYKAIGNVDGLAYWDGFDSKKDVKDLCMTVQTALKEGAPDDESHGEVYAEARMHYHMAAFNAVAEALVRTQRKALFYDSFLFDASQFGGHLWNQIVVTIDAPPPFKAETDFKTAEGRIGELQKVIKAPPSTPSAARFLSSQYLAGSSLAMDEGYTVESLNNTVDPTMTTQDSTQQMSTQSEGGNSTQVNSNADEGISNIDTEAQIELDPINLNPCMDLVVRAIRRRIEISKPDAAAAAAATTAEIEWLSDEDFRQVKRKQSWMLKFFNAIQELADKKNNRSADESRVLIFLLKVVVNLPDEFAPYARHFAPIMASVAATDGHNGGYGLHYFVRDCCLIILRWFGQGRLQTRGSEACDVQPISVLVNHLIEHVLSHNLNGQMWKRIFAANIHIIQDFVQLFKSSLQLDQKFILNHLTADTAKFNNAGIQLLTICLQEEVNLIPDNAAAMDELFLATIDLLRHKSKTVYFPACEVLGLALHTHSRKDSRHGLAWTTKDIGSPAQALCKTLYSFFKNQSSLKTMDHDKFVTCLHKVATGVRGSEAKATTFTGFPQIVGLFRKHLMQTLPTLKNEPKVRALSALTQYINTVTNGANPHGDSLLIMLELRPWINGLVEQRHQGVQMAILKLIRLLFTMSAPEDSGDAALSEAKNLIPRLCNTFTAHRKYKCREIFFDTLVIAWETFGAFEGIQEMLRPSLVRGLSDEAESVRTLIFNFWNDQDRLSNTFQLRLPQLMTNLYIPEEEERWPGLACSLLLKMCDSTRDFEEPIITNFGSTAAGDAEGVNTNFSVSDPYTTPMYASSQSQYGSTSMGLVEATQEPVVAETFDPGSDSAALSIADETQDKSAMDFVPSNERVSQQWAVAGKFKRPASRTMDRVVSKMGSGLVRFKSNRSANNNFYRESGSKKRKLEQVSQQRMMSGKRVRMFRKYRKGELPEFAGVTPKSIIEPLRALSLKDRMFSRLLLNKIYESVTEAKFLIACFKTPTAYRPFRQNLSANLVEMLRQTKASPTFVGWLLTAFARVSITDLDGAKWRETMSLLGQVSLKSNSLHAGINTLEHLSLAIDKHAGRSANQTEGAAFKARGGTYDNLMSDSGPDDSTMDTGSASDTMSSTINTYSASSLSTSTDDSVAGGDGMITKSTIDELWFQLGYLYKSLGEVDTVLGIWQSRIRETGHASQLGRQAVEAEMHCDYTTALEKYTQLKESKPLDSRVCCFGLLDCASKLQKWSLVAEEANSALKDLASDSSSAIAISTFTRSQFLDYLCLGCMNAASKDTPEKFHKILASRVHRNEDECRSYLEANHQLHLAVLSLYEGDEGRAKFLVDKFYDSFVIDWSGHHRLAKIVRLQKLSGLQKAVEIQEMMEVQAVLNNAASAAARNASPLPDLLRTWESRLPMSSEGLVEWKEMLRNRLSLLQMLKNKLQLRLESTGDEGDWASDMLTKVESTEKNLYSKVLKVMIANGDVLKGGEFDTFITMLPKQDTYIDSLNAFYKQALMQFRGPDLLVRLSKALNAVTTRLSSGEYGERTGEAWWTRAIISGKMALELQKDAKLSSMETDDSRVRGAAPMSTWEAKCDEHRVGKWQADSAIDSFEKANALVPEPIKPQVMFDTAEFCHKLLEPDENSAKIAESDRGRIAKILVDSLLGAMQLGSRQAQLCFPRVLSVVQTFPTAQQALASAAESVPPAMFLPWTCQLISRMHVKGSANQVITNVVAHVARSFPQDLYYPFYLILSDFDVHAREQAQPVINALSRVHPILSRFVKAIDMLGDPWVRLYEWMDLLSPLVNNNSRAPYAAMVKEMVADCLTPNESLQGRVNFNFARCNNRATKASNQGVADKLNKVCTRIRDLSKTHIPDSKQFKTLLGELKSAYERYVRTEQIDDPEWTKPAVSDFSRFLLNLETKDFRIELPNPFDMSGRSSAAHGQRVNIRGCAPKMHRFSSLRSPKVITFFGSDLHEYRRLGKSGEDLRLDQRLEQLYDLMNALLARDSDARKRHLSIRTFGVTPTSKRAGLVQMVANTCEMKDALDGAETKGLAIINDFLKRKYGNTGNAQYTGSNGPNVDGLLQDCPSVAARMYEQAVSRTTRNVLREYLHKLANSPEAYLTIRANFAKTVATFNIAGYITSVGDRHLGNFMLDQTDGGIVGIDFGQSFSVPLLLPIPDISPFRLSPQVRR